MAYDPTSYRGAAIHYRPGRPPYAPELEAMLTREAGLDGTGRLLDAGCGPGILTVRLAPLFAEAVGLDPDPDMLAEGRRAAEASGLDIRWVRAVAEELPEAAPGPYRMVTFGQSFFWTDESRVAELVYDLLEPGGTLALIGHAVEGRPKPPNPGSPPIPHDELTALVRRYLGPDQRLGQGVASTRPRPRFEEVLAGTRFGVPRTVFVPGIPNLRRDTESVLSGYFSLSSSAPHLFGDRADDFARDVRALLAEHAPDGLFWDWPGDTQVVLARKPT
ncbi:class I SAM-dependent methyltransferase [Microlunatus parietis]|uniref:SAM-dependent methyltransferase n=1 Tax=Microlunatus parietis TaxID=682979 RepID=A0A7Y9I9W5_9ACTN|nr:class I SAM-dependent methyltransferase [Microlunatus parietis]NYE72651.1 SAM-dependent methyltransferase [Microlunatus parietis]